VDKLPHFIAHAAFGDTAGNCPGGQRRQRQKDAVLAQGGSRAAAALDFKESPELKARWHQGSRPMGSWRANPKPSPSLLGFSGGSSIFPAFCRVHAIGRNVWSS
jgi:hypothetical protein